MAILLTAIAFASYIYISYLFVKHVEGELIRISIINRAFINGIIGYIRMKIRDMNVEIHYIDGKYVPLKNSAGNIIAVLSIFIKN